MYLYIFILKLFCGWLLKFRYSWCTLLYKLQVQTTVIHTLWRLHSMHVCVHFRLLQLCPPLCDSMARLSCLWDSPGILEWIAVPSSRESVWSRDQTKSLMSPALAGGFFTTSTTWEALSTMYSYHKILAIFPMLHNISL